MPVPFARAPMRAKLWTPAIERGRRLRAWYDAADTATVGRVWNATTGYETKSVDTWSDKSGLARTMFAPDAFSRPGYRRNPVCMLNGMPTISFWHSDGERMNAGNFSGANALGVSDKGFCVIAVVRARQWLSGGPGDGSGTYAWDRSAGDTGLPLWSCKVISGNWAMQVRSNTGEHLEGWQLRPVVAGRAVILSSHYRFGDPLGFNFRGWVSGELAQQQVASWGLIHPDPPRLGYGVGTPAASDVDIAEYIFLNDGEDHGLRERTEGYLAHKWGIELWRGHPCATVPPSVIAR
jgi:hypothetical protein